MGKTRKQDTASCRMHIGADHVITKAGLGLLFRLRNPVESGRDVTVQCEKYEALGE